MEQEPAVPSYVLRGHESPIHALHLYAGNTYLVSGDSEGWIVIWSLSSKRPAATWKAHVGGVMQIKHWTDERLVRCVDVSFLIKLSLMWLASHGRDHKLRVWKVQSEDFAGLSTKLPADGALPDQTQPWLLHSCSVNALNFCAFSLCDEDAQQPAIKEPTPQLVASPNGLDSGGIDIFQLPSERRVSQIHADKNTTSGMVMAVSLFHETSSSRLVLVSGYEDGRVMVHIHQGDLGANGQWQKLMAGKPHTQPVLSVDILPSKEHFISSSADATIAKYPLLLSENPSETQSEVQPERAMKTKHAGQQGLSIRCDGKIFATAGWDGRVRVYSSKTMNQLAVLKWHKVGCYATAFADVHSRTGDPEPGSDSPSHTSTELIQPHNALIAIKRQREEKARSTHWLAAGGKDGKISLWDIY
ncbi:uncharacterized protein Z518_05199 [Rhinocladiella mackenziei CBS 650.93]|uniref:ASTRA-associated protein 1 n=1 Tax=Rhinocladiella mackenziei CBS 650.93 TaxID=1442369 RepID=A0A0D2FQ53_9EURO|nr:uncharacterized protein Z518_05199 [Rhinocladiella mackenziei CBS 650.93]KIX04332.1 hypothetical protein Z518_05199 [Rhinocladiella mackenziei CBS 650.93]